MPTTSRPFRLAAAALASSAALLATALPAGACGGLVGENGTIQLTKTTTLAAYHDGVERYVTSFEFSGTGDAVGSIIPLPDVPTDVVRGGDWTLQRLEREVAPPADVRAKSAGLAVADSAEVILQTQIDALDITVLKGGGDEVGTWAHDNGFLLTPDAPEVLDFYGSRSQIFMVARFDAARASALGQQAGDGTPIMLTIPTDAPWVPLRILSLGLRQEQVVQADVFLLTDDQPELLAGGPGLSLNRSEPANPALLNDLRSDVGMGWVPAHMWFTYLGVDAPAGELGYDLSISPNASTLPTLTDTGVTAPQVRPVTASHPGRPTWPLGAGVLAGLLVLGTVGRRDRRPATPTGAVA